MEGARDEDGGWGFRIYFDRGFDFSVCVLVVFWGCLGVFLFEFVAVLRVRVVYGFGSVFSIGRRICCVFSGMNVGVGRSGFVFLRVIVRRVGF